MGFLVIEPVEIADNAVGNRCGDFLPEGSGAEQFFFVRIGNKRRLYQYRRNRWRFQHHERRLFGIAAVQLMHWLNLFRICEPAASGCFDGISLYQVEQHLLQ